MQRCLCLRISRISQGAKGAGEISEALKLGELRDRNWSIVACSAVDGSGVDEGMDWLVVSLDCR